MSITSYISVTFTMNDNLVYCILYFDYIRPLLLNCNPWHSVGGNLSNDQRNLGDVTCDVGKEKRVSFITNDGDDKKNKLVRGSVICKGGEA